MKETTGKTGEAMIPPFVQEYTVHSYESDDQGRARVTALLNYMQESAWNHAEALGVGYSHLAPKKLAWVLGRLRLQIFNYPAWGETVTLHTWPSGMDRLFCYRDFTFFDRSGKPFAVASTSWLVVDWQKRRPLRTETYIDLRAEGAEHVFPEFVGKLGAPEKIERECSLTVKSSHLDVNGHVNNVRYIEFVLDALLPESRRVSDVTVNFLNEARLGDEIVIGATTLEDETLNSLHRSDGAELCRVLIRWV